MPLHSRNLIYFLALLPLTAGLAQKDGDEKARYRYSSIFEETRASVVSILASANEVDESGVLRPSSTGGSGFIIDTIGTVITNKHVVRNASRIRVRLDNGDIFDAKIVGVAPDIDLAILIMRDPPPNLKSLKWGDSDLIRIGEQIIVIGSPLGFDATLTHGIVSALRRRVFSPGSSSLPPHSFIQVDAAINSGNSGGPVVNLAGEVIGVATLTMDPVKAYGISFAIPINVVKQVLSDVLSRRKETRNWVGLTLIPIEKRLVETFKLKGRSGLLVSWVESGSPAEEAGLKQGFVALKAGGEALESVSDWEWFLRNQPPNKEFEMIILRPPYYDTEQIVHLVVREKRK